MQRRLLQAAIVGVALTACSVGPAKAPAANSEKPFVTTSLGTFDEPWAMAFLPGSGRPLLDAALVTEKGGKLWLVDTRTGAKTAVAGVPTVRAAGQGGLGDVAVHRDFAGNQRVYLSYVEAGNNGTSGAVVGYGRLLTTSAAMPGAPVGYSLDSFKIIWRQSPKVGGNGHFGHRIVFGPDGFLYLSSGERQKFTPAQAFDGNLGKLLRLTDEGAPAPGNPWASTGGVAAQYWTIGHRNPLGLAFDGEGRLWETEMGPRGGDELNLIKPGLNYGWPRASNGSNYNGTDIPDHRPGDGFEPPKAWWNPSISPAGLMIYRGGKWPQWKGDAFLPALSGEALIRVHLSGDTATKADQWDMGARIRAVTQGPGGDIYLLEDGSGGKLLRLDPAAPQKRR